MQNYKRGYNFELRVRNKFRENGFEAERKAASAPYDLIVLKDGRVIFLIDAKKTAQRDKDYLYVSRESLERVIRESEKVGAQPLIAYGFWRTPIYVEFPTELVDKDGKNVRLEAGMELEEFLDKYEP